MSDVRQTDDGDALIYEHAGGNHQRPNTRRITAHITGGEIVLVEQMQVQGGTWRDVDIVATFHTQGLLDITTGPQAYTTNPKS